MIEYRTFKGISTRKPGLRIHWAPGHKTLYLYTGVPKIKFNISTVRVKSHSYNNRLSELSRDFYDLYNYYTSQVPAKVIYR